jgi:acetyltransferase-like isoleucine patch superfamily enzyme
MGFLTKIRLAFKALRRGFVIQLPDEFSRFKVRYYNKRGCGLHNSVQISTNVRLKGLVEMGEGSSIAQNGTLSGESAGIFIGNHVMIAPNVVIVAFNHGMDDKGIPMVLQPYDEAPVIIEDDVWIGANSTIAKGVRIGKGAVVAANSFVNKHVPEYNIVGGVPAKLIRVREHT